MAAVTVTTSASESGKHQRLWTGTMVPARGLGKPLFSFRGPVVFGRHPLEEALLHSGMIYMTPYAVCYSACVFRPS